MTEAKDKRSEEQDRNDSAHKAAKSAYECIAEMVACLDADRERLEELRDERDGWVDNDGGDDDEQVRTAEEWAKEFPDEAEELKEIEAAVTMDGEELDEDQARQRIQENPLSLLVRSGWYTLDASDEDKRPEEFELLLSTGGPASRIIGELDGNMEPHRARIQGQDWFTPWVEYVDADQDVLLAYCRCFYFGD